MTRYADQPELDFVLLNRNKQGGRYHRPVAVTFGYSTACGANTRDMVQVDDVVATERYNRGPCGKCWRAS
jgi:hypothetical protein